MSPRRGLQAEILISLAVLMITATTVLGVLLARSQQASGHRLHQLAARTLLGHRFYDSTSVFFGLRMSLN